MRHAFDAICRYGRRAFESLTLRSYLAAPVHSGSARHLPGLSPSTSGVVPVSDGAPALSWRLAVLVAAIGCGGTDQRALADAPLATKCAQMGGVWVKEWDAITNASGTFRCLKPLPLAEVTP
jgi:hypothetical protein